MWLGDLYRRYKKRFEDELQPVQQKVTSGLGAMAQKARDYFQPAPQVRTRDFVREVPKASFDVGRSLFSGTENFIKGAGNAFGTGLAYWNPGKIMGNYNRDYVPMNDLPTPTKMLANTGRSMLEFGTIGKAPKIATAAKFLPRLAYGSGIGYGFDVLGRIGEEGQIKKGTFMPGLATLVGGVMGAASKPALTEIKNQIIKGGEDITQLINPRTIIEKSQRYEPVEGIFAAGGSPQMRLRENAYQPKSALFKLLDKTEGKGGLSIKDISGGKPKNPFDAKIKKDLGEAFNINKLNPYYKGEKLKYGEDIVKAKAEQANIVQEEADLMKSLQNEFGGVEKIQTPNWDIHEYEGLRRVSTNPPWYRDFYARYGRKPNIQEAKKIFRKTGKAVDFENVLKPNEKPLAFGEIGGNMKKIRITGGAGKEIKIASDPYAGGNLEDISPTSKGFRDVYRNFERFFGNKYQQVKEAILDPFDAGKKQMFSNLRNELKELDTKIVKGMGFKKGSEKSADLQRFGEGTLSPAEIVKKYGQKELGNFIHANNWFRNQYDTLLDEVNAVRAQIYPGQADKIIPKRQDYYRHFQEMQEGLGGLINLFETPAGIKSGLAGVSQFTKPKSKWLSFAQRRLGTETTEDAISGFLNYLRSAEYAKNIDPHISNFRKLTQLLIKKGEKEGAGANYNNMIEFLQDFTDDLAGKTNPLDRSIQKYIPGGRKAFRALDWLNKRVKANVMLGNASSSFAQIFNVPQGIASAGEKNFAKGLVRLGRSISQDDAVMRQSGFLKERYFKDFNKFDTGMLKYPKQFAAWMITALDELGTKAIWNAHFEKAVAEGISNPVKYADDMARKMVAGRGIGEVPIVQKAKVFQMAAPFQLEVANVWHVLGDFGKSKEAGKIARMFLYTYLFNRVAEKVRGSDVALDPINALVEGIKEYQDEDNKGMGLIKASGRIVGEVLSNIPLGQTAASMYPEYGFKVGDTQFPVRKELFGKGDPTRFGSGILIAKGLQDPLSKILPPFGGVQAKRTIEGIKSYGQGYSDTSKDKVMFPIEKNISNAIKSATLGKYSTPEAREYFEEKRTPLGDVQSEKFKMTGNDYYDKVMLDRKAEQEKDKLKLGGNAAQASELGEGMKQLSNGEIYVPKLDETFKNPKDASLAIKKDEFKNSDENFMDLGNIVLRKSPDGTAYSTRKDSFMVSLYTAQLSGFKRNKDIENWKNTANDQYKLLNQMMQDPTIDELDKATIQNKIDSLQNEFDKFSAYGAFTKGRAAAKPQNYHLVAADPVFQQLDAIRNKLRGASAVRMPNISRPRSYGRRVSRTAPVKKIIRITRRYA